MVIQGMKINHSPTIQWWWCWRRTTHSFPNPHQAWVSSPAHFKHSCLLSLLLLFFHELQPYFIFGDGETDEHKHILEFSPPGLCQQLLYCLYLCLHVGWEGENSPWAPVREQDKPGGRKNMVKNLPAMQETWVQSLGREDPLEKGMAIHSSILAWRIAWTEEPCGL